MSRNAILVAVRNLIRERTQYYHPHRDAYLELTKKDDVELMGIVRTANTEAGARRMAAGWAKDRMIQVYRKRDAHEDEEAILANELAAGLNIQRYEALA